MIEIAFRCRTSEVLTGPKVIGRAQGEVDRGWQDKSADGCRAHVVGGMAILANWALSRLAYFPKSSVASMMQTPAARNRARKSHEPFR